MGESMASPGPAHSILEAGGWVLLVIFVVSAWAWVILASKWLELRQPRWRDRGEVLERSLRLLRRGAVAEAKAVLCGSPAVGARVLRAAMEMRSTTSAVAETLAHAEGVGLRRRLDFVAMLASTLPLLGLFGTVVGMFETFAAISSDARGTEVGSLAHGISRALVTTQAGLVTAVPVVVIHRWLAARVEGILARVEAALREASATLEGRDPPDSPARIPS